MLIAVIGNGCTGKSTIASNIKKRIGANIRSGRDYLKLAKNVSEAEKIFKQKLASCGDENIIYVISEKEQLEFLPEKCTKIYVKASIETIKKRFAKRMNGVLPLPVEQMIERKYGQFEDGKYDIIIDTDSVGDCDAADMILRALNINA